MRGWIVIALAAMALTGCNTVEGFGQDMANAGDAITGASQEVRTGHAAPTAHPCPAAPRNGRVGAPC